jgi:hypothetical protein
MKIKFFDAKVTLPLFHAVDRRRGVGVYNLSQPVALRDSPAHHVRLFECSDSPPAPAK